jgi:hypothetical protein
MYDMYTWQKWNLFTRDKPILSSEMLHKVYDHKGSVEIKKYLVVILKEFVAKTNWLAVNRQS